MTRIEMKEGGRAGYILSVALHLVIPALFFGLSFSIPSGMQSGGGTSVDLSGFDVGGVVNPGTAPENTPAATDNEPADTSPDEDATGGTVSNPNSSGTPAQSPAEKSFGNAFGNADTTGLGMVYSESTLNVRVRYPAGWKYIDQNKKKKLDGVSFVGPALNGVVPYVIVEVKEKYLFNPKRYLYKSELPRYTVYFNEPEELEGQVSYIAYIRTTTDEDYSLKMIVNGRENFNAFRPLFFSMLKSFSYGY